MQEKLYELEWQYKLTILRRARKLTMEAASLKLGKPKYFVEQLETGFLPLTEENVTLVLSLYGKTLKEFIAWRPKELQYPNYMPPKDMTQIQNNKKESFSNTEENQ